ncbi:MAG: YigZ family protein [Anaeroplasma bactoclasticum]|nr:YigZ family protein [Anaeroplasma bactoclasticum]
MNTIAKKVRITYEITKSEFITTLCPVSSVEEAKAFFDDVRHELSDATHHITAYTIGKSGEAGHYSDDGEPSGTAGLPVLDVFRKNEITNFACVVTRYFGGIKLGAGGLVRAYSTAASLALKEAGIVPMVEYMEIQLTFDYPYLDIIENRLKSYHIISRSFATKVSLTVQLPVEEYQFVTQLLINLTNNMIQIHMNQHI